MSSLIYVVCSNLLLLLIFHKTYKKIVGLYFNDTVNSFFKCPKVSVGILPSVLDME